MKNIVQTTFYLTLTVSILLLQTIVFAHQNGCHSWHSCPSDSGSYICGDKRFCSQCPDNQYCKDGLSISAQTTQQTVNIQPNTTTQQTTTTVPIQTCQSGHLSQYTCQENYRFQLYQYSNCTQSWKYVEYCLYGCSNGSCLTENITIKTTENISQTTIVSEPSIECKETFRVIVERVIDGDTLVVKGCSEHIRLSLVNTPEINEKGYSEAKSFTMKLCEVGSIATIDQDSKQPYDKYGRMVALVYCQNKKLNAELIYNKLAKIDTRFCSTSEFVNEVWSKDYGCEIISVAQPKTTYNKNPIVNAIDFLISLLKRK